MIAAQKNSGISRDEWLRALEDAGISDTEDDQEALTMEELAALLGIPRQTAMHRIKKLAEMGKVKRTHKWGTNSYGRRMHYVAWRLL